MCVMPIHVRHQHDGMRSRYFITVDTRSAALKRNAVLTALVGVFVVIMFVVDVYHMATTGTLTLARVGIMIVFLLIVGYGQFHYWKSTYTARLGRRGSGEPSVSPPVAPRALRRELSLL